MIASTLPALLLVVVVHAVVVMLLRSDRHGRRRSC
jgi:hypothetical protein